MRISNLRARRLVLFARGRVRSLHEPRVEFHHALHTVSLEAFGNAGSIGLVADGFRESWQVLLVVHDLDVHDGGGTSSHNVAASTKQVASSSHVLGIHVAGREVTSPQQHRKLF